MKLDEMQRRVTGARHGYLATASSTSEPHVVPLCFVIQSETVYSAVDWKPKRNTRLRRLQNIEGQPLVSLLVDHYAEDWERLWWVRLDGRADVLSRGDLADRAVALLAVKYPQYRLRPPGGPIIRISVERWSGWSANAAIR